MEIDFTKSDIEILKASLDVVLEDLMKEKTMLEGKIKEWGAVGAYIMPEITSRIEADLATYGRVRALQNKIENAEEN